MSNIGLVDPDIREVEQSFTQRPLLITNPFTKLLSHPTLDYLNGGRE
ncbi:hypothetical protein EYZ11_010508 [Aspergillus tanneri]|uniref:Uncharacterized protein n=1 Tax=Aspergillus tanneri TaxID=1220188 RepID=A0A4S3J575_9EURO|nr:hypothetical protein EYZ11_010508 [Aspergillus tanneri]